MSSLPTAADFVTLLPAECTEMILSLLTPHDLTAAMRVSSVWRHSAAPVLYRHAQIRSPEAMDALGRTVTEVPDLGNLVQRLCIHPGLSIDTGDLEKAAAAVVGRLPRLRALHFRGWAPEADFLHNAAGDFRELAELSWDHCHMAQPELDEKLMHLWQLPAIRSLKAHLCTGDAPLDPLRLEVWPTASTLCRLHLAVVFVAERLMGRLLRKSPALRILHYDRWCNAAGEIRLPFACIYLACH
jgi:F-box-like